MRNKREIERRPSITPQALNWIRNQKLELKKRKIEKESMLRNQEQMYFMLKSYISRFFGSYNYFFSKD